jgi:hypothetical protein
MQTATEIDQIAREFKQRAPKGFILEAANGGMIQSYLAAKGLPVTLDNISAAIEALKYNLEWEHGFSPVAPATVARDTRSQRQKAVDGGVNPYEPTHSDISESAWAKGVREGREKHIAENKKREREELRYRETHQTVMSPNGRISYAQSEALNKAAAQRHAEEDARESGRPAPVATGFRVIPATETNFSNYSAEEIKAYLAAKRGGRLMR